MNRNISPNSVKLKYLKCLESNYLNFYPSRKVFIKVSGGTSPFEVRFCPELVTKKSEASLGRSVDCKEKIKLKNPFLPYDRNLLVSELSPSYVLIFNKFCVVPEHLLIITTSFVEQSAEFNCKDFEAVDQVLNDLNDVNPLAFYNSSTEAGASQAHRHFQVISTEITSIDEHIRSVSKFDEPFSIPLYSTFEHCCLRRPEDIIDNWHFEAYRKLRESSVNKSAAYNLLWTRDWMLLVPRRKEFTDDGIDSINAMAFAGYFLTMNGTNLDQYDVIKSLQEVTFKSSQ